MKNTKKPDKLGRERSREIKVKKIFYQCHEMGKLLLVTKIKKKENMCKTQNEQKIKKINKSLAKRSFIQ